MKKCSTNEQYTSTLARILVILFLNSSGSGMRLMFLTTGVSGIITSIKDIGIKTSLNWKIQKNLYKRKSN